MYYRYFVTVLVFFCICLLNCVNLILCLIITKENLSATRRKQLLGRNHHKKNNQYGNFTKHDLKYNPHLQNEKANDYSKF